MGPEIKDCIVLCKDEEQAGQWVRHKHELLLIGTIGKMIFPSELPASIINDRTAQYEIIEKMYPSGKRVELFGQGSSRDGWDVWDEE